MRLSNDPARHPLHRERFGFVRGKIVRIHAARNSTEAFWVDHKGDVVVPEFVVPIDEPAAVLEIMIDEPGTALAFLALWASGSGDLSPELRDRMRDRYPI